VRVRLGRPHVAVFFLIIISSAFTGKVGRTFVFVRTGILPDSQSHGRVSYVRREKARGAYVLESADCVVDIARAELVQLLIVSEDDDRDIDLTENTKLVCFLEQTTLALEKGSARKKKCQHEELRLAMDRSRHRRTLSDCGHPLWAESRFSCDPWLATIMSYS